MNSIPLTMRNLRMIAISVITSTLVITALVAITPESAFATAIQQPYHQPTGGSVPTIGISPIVGNDPSCYYDSPTHAFICIN